MKSATKLPLNEINVGKRFRTSLGDIHGLAKSMEDVGLINPILLNSKHELIAGMRRLEAAKILSWEEIDVRVVSRFDDAHEALRGERDENECREEMTIKEKVAIAKALEDLERPKAKARKTDGASARDGRPSENFTEGAKGQTRDKVGKAVGMSGIIYERAKRVVEAAEEDPETFGDIAEQMDQTGKVTPAYNKVLEIRKEHEDDTGGKVRRRSKAIDLAHEAVNCLMRIPKNDPKRERGFQIVMDFIKANKD